MARVYRYNDTVVNGNYLGLLVEDESTDIISVNTFVYEFTRGGAKRCGNGPVLHTKAWCSQQTTIRVPDSSYTFLIKGYVQDDYGNQKAYYCDGEGNAYAITLWSSNYIQMFRYRVSNLGEKHLECCKSSLNNYPYMRKDGLSQELVISLIARSSWIYVRTYNARIAQVEFIPPDPNKCNLEYHYDEKMTFLCINDLGIIPKSVASKFCKAFESAVDHIPQTTTNTIANVLEVASALSSLIKGDFGDIAKFADASIGDRWLAYRYSYSTTKSDINEYISLTSRLVDIVSQATVTCYGSYVDATGSYRCQFDLMVDDIVPKTTSEWLRAYGLRINLYTAWDLIPYSFVVDWFLNIGHFLEQIEKLGCLRLDYHNMWYSYQTTYPITSGVQQVYYRFAHGPIVTSAWFSPTQATNKTIVKRIADTMALFFN